MSACRIILHIHQQRWAHLSEMVVMAGANESGHSRSPTCHLSPIIGHESLQTFEGSQHHKTTPSWKDTLKLARKGVFFFFSFFLVCLFFCVCVSEYVCAYSPCLPPCARACVCVRECILACEMRGKHKLQGVLCVALVRVCACVFLYKCPRPITAD